MDWYKYIRVFQSVALHKQLRTENVDENGHYSFQQGCQMAYFQTKNTNKGELWRALQWKMLCQVYGHLVYFEAIWYIL
jgi:hypothetical protein